VGIAAYRAGEWQTAVSELRTYQRLTGRQTHLAVLADCERALGRPEKAVDMFRAADRAKLTQNEAIELLIVAAGARADLGQKDAAVAMLQVRELTAGGDEAWAARLRYAYADALLGAGRAEEAREWFSRAVEVDEEGDTAAAERLLELDGVNIEGDDLDDEENLEPAESEESEGDESDESDEDDEDLEDEEDEEDDDEEDDDYEDSDSDDESDEDEDESEIEAGGEEHDDELDADAAPEAKPADQPVSGRDEHGDQQV